MCGIVGFTGNRQVAPILLDGLSKLGSLKNIGEKSARSIEECG